MYLIGILIWTLVSCVVAWLLAYGLTRRAKARWPRWVTTAVLFPVVFIAPLADEIVGKYQFERLCEGAKEVTIHATHPVGEELYTPDGKWREGQTRDEERQLRDRYEALVRWDLGSQYPASMPSAILIHKWHRRIFDRTNDRLLAEWDDFSTRGGWLSRNLETPFLVRPQCGPPLVDEGRLHTRILPFDDRKENQK